MESTRTCRKCEVGLTEDNTYDRRRVCKQCHKAESRENKRKAGNRARTCEKCRVFKDVSHFPTKRGYCAECLGRPIGEDTQKCHGCKKWKDPELFLSTAKYARCAECRKRSSESKLDRHKPRFKVSLRKGKCTRCHKRQGYPNYEYNPSTRKYATVCNACRYKPQTWTCTACGEDRPRDQYLEHHWTHRRKKPAECLTCRPARLHLTEYHDYEYRFARDVVGMTHANAIDWMQKSFGGLVDSYYAHYGWPDNPKPYEPYKPDPITELERKLIEYTDLSSQTVEGTVWCEGPKDKTVWVIRKDGGCAVVNPTKGIEVEYELPQWIHPIPEEVLQTAKDVIEGYAQAKREMSGLGFIKPIGQDYTIAATLLAQHRAHQRARKPFLDGHATRASISTKRLRELTKEDTEVNP